MHKFIYFKETFFLVFKGAFDFIYLKINVVELFIYVIIRGMQTVELNF